MSAQRLAETAADALDTVRDQMKTVVGLVGSIGEQVDRFRIPTVEPRYSEGMGLNLVTGIEFGETSVLDDAVSAIRDGATNLGSIESSLDSVAGQLRNLVRRLTEAGDDLDRLGNQLQESGGVLREVATIGS